MLAVGQLTVEVQDDGSALIRRGAGEVQYVELSAEEFQTLCKLLRAFELAASAHARSKEPKA